MSRAGAVPATLGLAEAAAREWEVLIVGAGPAGSVAAHELARAGARVLLVDRAAFPRTKVCGCCLGAAALAILRGAGLGRVAGGLGGVPLRRFALAAPGGRAELALPAGLAISRASLDAALAAAAVGAGASFLPGVSASLVEPARRHRHVRLTSGPAQAVVAVRFVLAADGLPSRLLADAASREAPAAAGSRMGVAAILHDAPVCAPGTIWMCVGRRGYIGAVRLEDGRLNIAGALDPAFVRAVGGPARAVEAVWREAGGPPLGELSGTGWRGTPALTRRPARLGAHRLLVIGDAAGYVEPFTGEGIAWAMASARAAAPLALAAAERWDDRLVEVWTRRHRRLIGPRQRACRVLCAMLRRPGAVGAAIRLAGAASGLAAPVVRRFAEPWFVARTFAPGVGA